MRFARLVLLALSAWLFGAEDAHSAHAAPAGDASRLRLAELVATGPLTSATLDVGSAGRATLEFDLAAGETRHLVVALPVREGFDAVVPVSSDARLRFVDWGADAERARAFAAVPLGLRLRPAPPPPSVANAPSLAALALAVAAACCIPRLRARPRLALLFGVVAACAVLALELARVRPVSARVVVDFDSGESAGPGESAGIEWRSARDELGFGASTPLALAVVPDELPLELRIDARGDRPARTVVRARGAALAFASPPARPPPGLARNGWGELAEVWTRSADGAWTAHGAWAVGSELPAPLRGDRRPPGWVNPALPQGRKLLIGRAAALDDGAEVWIRVVGP